MNKYKRKFICYFWFVGWDNISLGIHISPSNPNLEIHIPFGFIRIGWRKWQIIFDENDIAKERNKKLGWGLMEDKISHYSYS